MKKEEISKLSDLAENEPEQVLTRMVFELARPCPLEFRADWPVGTVNALRVIVGCGGKLSRKGLLYEWRAGDPNFGPAIADKYVQALCDTGYLEARFETV